MVGLFAQNLLGKPSHESITKLLDGEIKMLEAIKKTLIIKLKKDLDYSRDLSQVVSQSPRLENLIHESPLAKIWETIVAGISLQAGEIKSTSDTIHQNTVEKLETLLRDKIAIKKFYHETRDRLDNNLYKTIHSDLEEKQNLYLKMDKETAQVKRNYENCLEKANVRNISKLADKYRKTTMKLHISHNSYVMQLLEARKHQQFYRETQLPSFLDSLEDLETEYIRTCDETLAEYVNEVLRPQNKMVEWSESFKNVLKLIKNPFNEYKDFIEKRKSPINQEASLPFEKVPVEGDNLGADKIILNSLTVQSVETTTHDLADDVMQLNRQLDESRKKLEDLNSHISMIRQEYSKLSLMSKKLAVSQATIDEMEQLRLRDTYQDICNYLNNQLERLGEFKPPPGLVLPEVELESPSHAVNSEISNFENVKTSVAKKFNFLKTKIYKNSEGSTKTTNKSVEDEKPIFDKSVGIQLQTWFHGQLTREETKLMLLSDGDFLLRESNNIRDVMILSVCHGGSICHYKINANPTGEYVFEGNSYTSIVDMIEYYHASQLSLKKEKRGLLLKNPICRDKWLISHDDVELYEQLGQGNFGTVNRGFVRSKNVFVAVKTCREAVDITTRQKFLAEAKILKGYSHPNVVQLIGVCTSREPIYILMELVNGGDLKKFIETNSQMLTSSHLLKITTDACAGLAYLESMKCIHRDVAARNCLVNQPGMTIKITDFGMSREEEDGVYTVSGRLRAVPMKWTAPESMNYGKFTHSSDVWSFGVMCWEVFTYGMQPYPGLTNAQAREYVEQGNRMECPPNCSREFYDKVMTQCWRYNADQRPSFAELMQTITSIK